MKRLFPVACVLCCFISAHSFAGSATWKLSPASGDWNTAANWTTGGPPNGPSDTATFALTSITGVSLSTNTEVNGIAFNAGASAFSINAPPTFQLTISGSGITNNSAVTQNFVSSVSGTTGEEGGFVFSNSASARVSGNMVVFTNPGSAYLSNFLFGGFTQFDDTSTAGTASFINNGGTVSSAFGGYTSFSSSATAATGRFTNNASAIDRASGGFVDFYDSATAANGSFINHGSTVSGAGGGFTRFFDGATAASGTFTNNGAGISGASGGLTQITSTADRGTFTNNGGMARGAVGGTTSLLVSATAASGTFTNNPGMVAGALAGHTIIGNTSTAGSGIFTNMGARFSGDFGGFTQFNARSTADHGTFTNNGGAVSGAHGGHSAFHGSATAGNGTFMNNGGAVSGAFGGSTSFLRTSTAANGTFFNNAGTVSGAGGGRTRFDENSTAGNATLIANGGLGSGGTIQFLSVSTGGTARVEVFDNGSLDISDHDVSGVTIGSLEGDGIVLLGANSLTVGANNLSTKFSGEISGSGPGLGSLTKTGIGTLILNKGNTYDGGTTIYAGELLVTNTTGSATGTGAVLVNAGELGGTGRISGAVTVGSGSLAALLRPGINAHPGTLTLLNTLTFGSNGTYQVDLNSVAATADQTVADGVTINSNAIISPADGGFGTLTIGTVFTIISNTATTPIDGTFKGSPEGSIESIRHNKYLISYKGGDGNDLTLTVVP